MKTRRHTDRQTDIKTVGQRTDRPLVLTCSRGSEPEESSRARETGAEGQGVEWRQENDEEQVCPPQLKLCVITLIPEVMLLVIFPLTGTDG